MDFDIQPLLGWWNTTKIGWNEEFCDILTLPLCKKVTTNLSLYICMYIKSYSSVNTVKFIRRSKTERKVKRKLWRLMILPPGDKPIAVYCYYYYYYFRIKRGLKSTLGESNGKLSLRTCPGCSVPEPYQSPDWALVPTQTSPRAE
jgi:hypothetical protein